jgi:putative aldouronate transport system substrate-binding protein
MRDWTTRFVLVLVVLVLAAAPVFAAGTQQAAAADDVTTIRWFGTRGVPSQNAPITGMLERMLSDKLGYEVRFELSGTPDDDFQPVLNLALAAQDLPDVFLVFAIENDFTRQAVAKFELEEMLTHMPRMSSMLVELMSDLNLDEDQTWAIYQDDQGRMWGTPRIWDMGWVPSGHVWRKDILDELGFDVPRTIAETEEVFAAYKARYPDRYALAASGRSPAWQAFDFVFSAFRVPNGGHSIRDGVVRQHFAFPEYRQALEVLARWYSLGYIDPEFITMDNQEKMRAFAQGRHLVVDWIGYANWHLESTAPNIGPIFDNVPGAQPVMARHIAADESTQPMQRAWNPFLTQMVAFGKHLERDIEHMRKVMQVGDLISNDRETWLLANSGIEGEHYFIPEGEIAPQLVDRLRDRTGPDLTEEYGFGFFWTGRFSMKTPLPSWQQASIERYVNDPQGIYNLNSIDYWLSGVITGAVRDENDQDIGAMLAADTDLDYWVMSTRIILGQEPISYYDAWLQRWYRSGGELWERHATRLYGN